MTGEGIPSWRLTKSRSEVDDLWFKLCLRLVAGRVEYFDSCLPSSVTATGVMGLILAAVDTGLCTVVKGLSNREEASREL